VTYTTLNFCFIQIIDINARINQYAHIQPNYVCCPVQELLQLSSSNLLHPCQWLKPTSGHLTAMPVCPVLKQATNTSFHCNTNQLKTFQCYAISACDKIQRTKIHNHISPDLKYDRTTITVKIPLVHFLNLAKFSKTLNK
jgi:hypothetical protein